MSGVINTGSHPKLLWPGIHALWGQQYNAHPTEYTDLFDVESSSRAYEEDVEITGFGLAPIKTQGGSISYDSEHQGWVTRYVHVAYALGYIVTKEELDDNLYKEVSSRRAKGNAFSMQQTVENVAAFLYNNAFNTTYYATPDTKAIIATDHLSSSGSTFSNRLTTPADLTEASLEDMCTQIMDAVNGRGLKISVVPQSLIIPTAYAFDVERILKSSLQSGTANNDINALRAMGAFPKGVKVNHYLTDSDAWFVRTNIPNGPKLFWRAKPQFDQDNDFDTKNAKAASYMRLSVGITDPRGLYGSPGA